MRLAAAAILALSLVAAASGAPADQPLLRPSRDVDVTYRATGGGGAQGERRLEQRVRWLVAAQRMRIDPPNTGLFVIIDYLARRMSVVREVNRSVIEMAASEAEAGMTGNLPAGLYVRRGVDTVAGQACTEWETRDRDGRQAVVCITADGVLLRAASEGQVLAAAVSVQYAPQDPALFQVPPGYVHRSAGARP
jgi:hypothetical protein